MTAHLQFLMHNDALTTVAADMEGTGPTILLLHGIPGDRRSWTAVVRLLRDRFRVLVPDLAGFGATASLAGNAHAAEQAEMLEVLLYTLGIGQVHVVGFDFGGPVAMALHQRAAHRFLSLVLISTNVRTDTPVPLPLRLAKLPVIGDLMFAAMFSPLGVAALRHAASIRREQLRTAGPAARLNRRSRKAASAVFLHSLRNLETLYEPIQRELANVTVPTSILWGDSDPFFSVETARRTAASIPQSKLVILERCGHFVPEECAAETAAIIAETVTLNTPP